MHKKIKVRLAEIRGDEDHEFDDMVDYEGELHITSGDNWFSCENGSSVTFVTKRIAKKGDTIRVYTRLGNTFVFKIVPKEVLAERMALRIRRAETELAQMRREQESLR